MRNSLNAASGPDFADFLSSLPQWARSPKHAIWRGSFALGRIASSTTVPAVQDYGWRLPFMLCPAALSRLLLLLRSAALGRWRLLLLLRPTALGDCLLLLLLQLSARDGLRVFLLLCPAILSSFRLLLLLRTADLGGWQLLFLLRPAALSSFRLLLLLRPAALSGWQLLFLLQPAALSPLLLLIRSPALHPWLRLLSQSLFLTLLLLMLLLLIAAYWPLTGRREALARDGHRWCRFAAAINTRTGRAIARGRLADPVLPLPILVGGGIHFTFIVLADLRELEGLWFGRRQRHMPAGLGHIDHAWKQHHESTRMANAIRDATGFIAGAPVQIGARRSDDRRSRILRNHEATKR
jgi:hypothetical protein